MSLGKRRRTQIAVDEEGVSPVIGMILVLAISIVGIAAILYWGLPAIDEMKSNVEHRSVEQQFVELDSSIKELVAGTTEKAAKRWQPSLSRGSVTITQNVEAWLYATDMYDASKDYDFIWYDFGQVQSHAFIVGSKAETADNVIVKAYLVKGTASEEALIVNANPAPSPVTQMAARNFLSNEAVRLYVFEADGDPVDFSSGTYLFTIEKSGVVIAKAWYVTTGLIDYSLEAGIAKKSVIQNNGAVLSGSGDSFLVTNAPPIPPQTTPPGGTPRFFARAITLSGDGSFAGDDRFDVLMSLYATNTLASYDCAGSPTVTTCVETSKIIVFGKYRAPWEAYLDSAGRGYDFDIQTFDTSTAGLPDPSYLGYRESHMGYTLLQSTVSISTSG